MSITGELVEIGEVKEFGSNGFTKREVVVKTKEQYPQYILINFLKEKTKLVDSYKVGSEVTIDININGRRWESPDGQVKYFNDITGWRISAVEAEAPVKVKVEQEGDDLPF